GGRRFTGAQGPQHSARPRHRRARRAVGPAISTADLMKPRPAMPTEPDDYWSATRHPWACVLFVLPLRAAYEVGLFVLGEYELRNGADVWLRHALAELGLSPIYAAPFLLISILLAWGLVRREGRPTDKVGVWVGMIAESAAYAVLLLGLCQGLWLALQRAD